MSSASPGQSQFRHSRAYSRQVEQYPSEEDDSLSRDRQSSSDAYSRHSRAFSRQSQQYHTEDGHAVIKTSISDVQSRHSRAFSRQSEPYLPQDAQSGEDNASDKYVRRPIPSVSAPQRETLSAPVSAHALATPRPTLLFAIASDDVKQVRKVLENGDAGPNDSVGPQSALAFTLTNDQLSNKLEIVKALLAYGADPNHLKEGSVSSPRNGQIPPAMLDKMDTATRYVLLLTSSRRQ